MTAEKLSTERFEAAGRKKRNETKRGNGAAGRETRQSRKTNAGRERGDEPKRGNGTAGRNDGGVKIRKDRK